MGGGACSGQPMCVCVCVFGVGEGPCGGQGLQEEGGAGRGKAGPVKCSTSNLKRVTRFLVTHFKCDICYVQRAARVVAANHLMLLQTNNANCCCGYSPPPPAAATTHHCTPTGPSGRTALHTAVSRGSKEVAELLLANGADINAV